MACAASHPTWWGYASPDATALVGIRWDRVQVSPFAPAIGGLLEGNGGLGIPDLECLKHARQILLSAPPMLVMESGDFPAAVLQQQAGAKALKHFEYRGVDLWITPGQDALSVAQISEQLLLLGQMKTLEGAIDLSMDDSRKDYSPLLVRGARYADQDLWIVASQLPDPLASQFVPVDVESEGLEAAVSVEGGLQLGAAITADTEQSAAAIADTLRKMVPTLPAVARGMQIDTKDNAVLVTMDVSQDQLAADLRGNTPPPAPAPPAPAPAPVAAKAEPRGPQVVKILGLDDGPREIALPIP
jgi:hypothetical protein